METNNKEIRTEILKRLSNEFKKDIENYRNELKHSGKLVTSKLTLKMFKRKGLIYDFDESSKQIDMYAGTNSIVMFINNAYYFISYINGSLKPYIYKLNSNIISEYSYYIDLVNAEFKRNNIALLNSPIHTEKKVKEIIEYCKG